MSLDELIVALGKIDPAKVVPRGFSRAHSYRGYYDQLAFEPSENVKVGDMLQCATEAKDQVFTGYKGGDYKMEGHVDVWIARYGHAAGELIGDTLVWYWANCEPVLADERPFAKWAHTGDGEIRRVCPRCGALCTVALTIIHRNLIWRCGTLDCGFHEPVTREAYDEPSL